MKYFVYRYRFDSLRRRLHGRRGLKYHVGYVVGQNAKSPPSRAAWIEIDYLFILFYRDPSPPSRAAWIEIVPLSVVRPVFSVAAFTGGVD